MVAEHLAQGTTLKTTLCGDERNFPVWHFGVIRQLYEPFGPQRILGGDGVTGESLAFCVEMEDT